MFNPNTKSKKPVSSKTFVTFYQISEDTRVPNCRTSFIVGGKNLKAVNTIVTSCRYISGSYHLPLG